MPCTTTSVAHSAGTQPPNWVLPALACDSHMHIFEPDFAKSPHWPRTPPVATVAHYRQLQARLGSTRAVVVTPSTYGTDNRCTLHAIAQLNTQGDVARGVAVVAADASYSELAELARQKICGLRVNFVSPQSWGETTLSMLQTLAAKAADLGWHIQVFMTAAQINTHQAALAALPVPLVIDHMGLIAPAAVATTPDDTPAPIDAPALAAVLRLLDGGRAWVKLSGAYMRSAELGVNDAGLSCTDMLALARALITAAPQRVIWGSDWPHTTARAPVDDAALLNWLGAACAGHSTTLERILVANPAKLYGFETP